MRAFEGPFTLREELDASLAPEADVAERRSLLDAVAQGASGQVVRLARPRPTAAFSRRDVLLPGYARAAEVAGRHGFDPVVRPVGGRMAPYHQGCLVVDVVARSDRALPLIEERFEAVAGLVAEALRSLRSGVDGHGGLDVRIGPVPGEYCPGAHSVNIAGTTKVAGTAQRQVRGAALVSTVVVVTDAAPLRAVTTDVYAALGLDLDPATVGCVADHAPGVTVAAVRDALVQALGSALPELSPRRGRPSCCGRGRPARCTREQ